MTDKEGENPEDVRSGYEGHLGNRWWRARSTHGRSPLFEKSGDLRDACDQYFEWAETNTLTEYKVAQYQGQPVEMKIPKMRAMTISGMCLYIGISNDTWSNYRKKDDFLGVTKWAEQVIYDQKFAGASADMLNANIIARDLGLADKTDHSSSDGSMSPSGLSEDQKAILAKAQDDQY